MTWCNVAEKDDVACNDCAMIVCRSSFWIRFNQRYHRLRPADEVYTAEIERSLINVILANQAAPDADPPGMYASGLLSLMKG